MIKLQIEFFIQVKTAVNNVLYEYTGEKSATSYTIHLHPCVVFRNLLPTAVSYTLEVGTVISYALVYIIVSIE